VPKIESLFAALFPAVVISLLAASCAEEGGAFLYVDRYWRPVVEAAADLDAVLVNVRKETGKAVRIEPADPEKKAAADMERFLTEKRPRIVFFGSFIAFEIQALAEKNPEVSFVALDAPDDPPTKTPFRWIRFTKDDALREIGSKLRLRLDSSGGQGRPVLVVIGNEYREAYARHLESEAFVDPGKQSIRIDVNPKDSFDSVKSRLAEELKRRPPFCVLLAGGQTAALFGVVRKEGPLPLVVGERGRLAETEDLPILYSFEKDYAGALVRGLASDLKPGEVAAVPMKVRPGTAAAER